MNPTTKESLLLLRRITKHVKDQNWFAVALDFVIVVVGVFIGIQVANWNDARAEYRRETAALVELKKEIEASIVATEAKSKAYQQATDAGKRSLAFLEQSKNCGANCWDLIVDLMHASQWQDLYANDASYQNMRNQGFPKSVAIVDAVEAYLAQNRNNADTFQQLPVYRSLVRQLVSVEAQEHYWAHCWSLVDGIEAYNLDCPEGVSQDVAHDMVEAIAANPGLRRHLTEWIGAIVSLPTTLGDQNKAALQAIDLIEAEIRSR